MSLINEALKKAQRHRSDQPPGISPTIDGDEHRPRPMRKQSVVLLVSGAALLVAFSVLITVSLLSHAPAPSAPAVVANPPKAPVDLTESNPPIVAPAIVLSPALKEPPPESAPAVVAVTAPPVEPPKIEIPPISVARQPELQTQLFVDAVRVMGVRSQGGESKVMMNDRVYRVNDIVDRTLVLKLVKVEPELLTFTDANGMVYTKSF